MQRLLKNWTDGDNPLFAAMVISAVFFFVGAIAGGLFAANVGDPREVIAQTTAFTTAPEVGLLQAMFGVFKYPVLALLLGLSLAGVAAIPALLVVRGFLISFAITAFVRVFGLSGLAFSFALLFVQCFVVLPVFLFISARGFVTARELVSLLREGKKPLVFRQRYAMATLACAAVLALAALLECYITPALASFVKQLLTL